jgi:hypothetical protein
VTLTQHEVEAFAPGKARDLVASQFGNGAAESVGLPLVEVHPGDHVH